ncbi:Ribosomal_protein L13 [Hexamita inflata]|uniref:Ribosomal protein L13 n=1 Tax=Hexamita inflata TaxID=28002 RepID=A0AA86QCE7_9EUKA|nr:Ribosomal protein L13 [Hexamita inflata]CAI9950464.1 Ribosomal protein L13 [Hexamita inflata]CAI9960722.1 Ribosomal protein L13 [Hexamita inflata]
MPNVAFSLMKKQKCQHKGTRLTHTWFDQHGKAVRRHQARVKKAERVFPRPIDQLRPVVQCPGIMHNTYTREGRGFTLDELKAVKLTVMRARQLNIAVDARRVNKTQQGLDRNTIRLQDYLKKVVVFKKDAKPEEIKAAVQVKAPAVAKVVPTIATGKVDAQPKMDVYATMHALRLNRLVTRNISAIKKQRLQNKKK